MVSERAAPSITTVICNIPLCPSRLELPGDLTPLVAAEHATTMNWWTDGTRHVCPSHDGATTRLRAELGRLRSELEARTNELHAVQRELAELQQATRDVTEVERKDTVTALIEALAIAQSAGRRGLLSTREHERLRELAKVVPQ